MADYKEEYVNINGILQYFLHYKKKDGAPVYCFCMVVPVFLSISWLTNWMRHGETV